MENDLSLILTGAFWVIGFLLFWKAPLLPSSLPPSSLSPPFYSPSSPSVPSPAPPPCPASVAANKASVIIPARNEAGNLESLLGSLNQQTRPPDEILVIDDHSTDETPQIATSHGATLVSLPEIPEGWIGKAWALWTGANKAKGDILIFLDADTRLERDGLSLFLSEHQKKGGLVSVQPYHVMKKAYEKLSAFFNIVLFLNMNIASVFARITKPLGAFGPCLVCSRRDYFSVGGHQAVKGKIVEDIILGRRFMEHGHPLSCYAGKGAVSFRMYPQGLRQLVEGWTKNFASGAFRSKPILLLLSGAWITGCLSAILDIVKGLAGKNEATLFTGCVFYLLFAIQIHLMLRQLGNFGLWPSIFYAGPLLFFLFVFLRSILFTSILGYVTWRGRKIYLKRRQK